ncbi:acetoacetyl-coenzyme A synthetase [Phytophthora infestans T30-4]|uniref:Acetoacetyl-coenzyme A synthetase n=1 Tax=Phytophthora infestans (strain T30-4) TaxID=403677 RepID=D0NPG3_PHYIT|nr:acetoacetyl-coenzyme A synthetase [Phytophthora infestans T30-4]EEY62505.1 acetoacetyl-coenzyme A synthetase [Phytophthora infestans T30-4]|eukprot:XP_002899141.1 acetoacetyl-coenzyme A synthetase [Phytophthora infestans T30-4]
MPGAKFFPGARLNFAENLLRFRDDRPAIIFKAETSNQETVISYKALYERVAKLSARLAEMGIVAGDRVAAFIPNIPEAIIAMLATTSLGAIWSSCSPDFGAQGVLDRFAQITPKVVFTTDGYFYKGNRIDIFPQLKTIIDELPTIRSAVYYDRFIHEAVEPVKDSIPFAQLPFDHPVYVMYSSGTTGLPKCLVQGPGVVLNHLKELAIHLNIRREDRVFYYTTTGWMMWTWLVSSLGIGATIVLFDGNPLYPSTDALWKYAQDVGVTVFGTSARYLAAVMDSGCVPGKKFDLSKLKLITSTGSPASTNIFKFVYEGIKSDVQFASISGGTDLNGCFALGCTNLPVCDSELQTRGLGLDVRIFTDDGQEITQEQGELVCKQPFPSMPLYFWNDDSGAKYHDAYFDTFPDIWKHGDFAEVTKSGGVIIYGRSDATLKPGGVRIGTADIYKVLEKMEEVADSVVVGQSYTLNDGTPDVRILLFVVMAEGHECTSAFQKKVRQRIRDQTSPRHMPGMVVACPAIPHTVSGKKVELTVKKIIDGHAVTNKNALQNPESLDWFEEFAMSLREKICNRA